MTLHIRQHEYIAVLKSPAMDGAAKKFDMELLFRALADRTRLRLLNLMGRDEVCVCYFVEVLKTPQPKISRHLAYLRRAGIVGARREGKWMHYRITEPVDQRAAEVLKNIQDWLASDLEMEKDRGRLVRMCCVKVPSHLRTAPKPVSITALPR
jgi:ArsR family transcriptional regulator